jgi:hypothetical protein
MSLNFQKNTLIPLPFELTFIIEFIQMVMDKALILRKKTKYQVMIFRQIQISSENYSLRLYRSHLLECIPKLDLELALSLHMKVTRF